MNHDELIEILSATCCRPDVPEDVYIAVNDVWYRNGQSPRYATREEQEQFDRREYPRSLSGDLLYTTKREAQ